MKRFCYALAGFAVFAAMALATDGGVAHGKGVIQTSNLTLGVFSFRAAMLGDSVRGYLDFLEVIQRPDVRRRVINTVRVKVEKFSCSGKEASFGGPALFNGRRAFAEVFVADRWHPGSPLDVLDHFELKVFTPDGTTVYRAEGPVVRGDIVVRCGRPPGR